MPMNKKPCVVAGLMATLGLGATLVATPVTALADEVASAVPVSGDEVVAEGIDDAAAAEFALCDSGTTSHIQDSTTDKTAMVGDTVNNANCQLGTGSDLSALEDGSTELPNDPAGAEPPSPQSPNSDVESAQGGTVPVGSAENEMDSASNGCASSMSGNAFNNTFNGINSLESVSPSDADEAVASPEYPTTDIDHQPRGEENDGTHSGVDKIEVEGKLYLVDENGEYLRGNAEGWVVTDRYDGSMQRYHIGGDHAVDTLDFTAEMDGRDEWFYGDPDEGYVARGKYTADDGKIYLADDAGRLEEGNAEGWVVTDRYDGVWRRYYIEDHHVRVGTFTALMDGEMQRFYGVAGQGYVYQGKRIVGNDIWLYDNAGRLETGNVEGWVVSQSYDGVWRRYYVGDSDGACATGAFSALMDGVLRWFYGVPGLGYVAQGKYVSADGALIYLADNAGRLEEGNVEGWLVTTAYDGVWRRYHINENHSVDVGLYSAKMDGKLEKFFGVPYKGYVVTGREAYDGTLVFASGGGVLYLQDSTGFVWSSEIEGTLQRYYIVQLSNGVKGAKTGLFKVGNDYYYGLTDKGYLLRDNNKKGMGYRAPDGGYYRADYNGVLQYHFLSEVGWRLYDIIWNTYSSTNYLIAVDCDNCHTVVFQGSAGNWTLIFDWLCGVGLPQYNGGQGTIRGTYTIGGDGAYCNWTSDPDYSEYGRPYGYQTTYFAKDDIKWYTNFCLDLGFHSTIGWDGGYSDPNQIGKKISHGCIRLLEENARWIYYNATYGTTVVTI